MSALAGHIYPQITFFIFLFILTFAFYNKTDNPSVAQLAKSIDIANLTHHMFLHHRILKIRVRSMLPDWQDELFNLTYGCQ